MRRLRPAYAVRQSARGAAGHALGGLTSRSTRPSRPPAAPATDGGLLWTGADYRQAADLRSPTLRRLGWRGPWERPPRWSLSAAKIWLNEPMKVFRSWHALSDRRMIASATCSVRPYRSGRSG